MQAVVVAAVIHANTREKSQGAPKSESSKIPNPLSFPTPLPRVFEDFVFERDER